MTKHVMTEAACLLQREEDWALGGGKDEELLSPQRIDVDCVILGHYVKAFAACFQQPFHVITPPTPSVSSLKSKSKSRTGAEYPLPATVALERVDQLIARCEGAMRAKAATSVSPDSWKFYIPKLLLMKAILHISHTGHLLQAKQMVDAAASVVHDYRAFTNPLLNGLKTRESEPEMGLFMLAQAELMARIWNWGNETAPVERVQVDEDVLEAFDNAAGFYAAPYSSNTHADGIMDVEKVKERAFEVHAYVVCLLSLVNNVLLRCPRPPGTTSHDRPVFCPQQQFSLYSPLTSVVSPSLISFTDSSRLEAFSVEKARKMAGRMLERGLQLSRALYDDEPHHPLTCSILAAMACLYADTRDYLYASGLFEAARKGLVKQYGGSLSPEVMFLDKLRYEFLAGVGSNDEAATAAHDIVQRLKLMDQLSCA